MASVDPIKITGLAEFNRSLRKINADLPKELRGALNTGAEVIVRWGQARIPTKSGKARKSLRASSTRTAARVTGGGARVPYYPWLDFGGKVGRKKSVKRAFLSNGRYIFAGYSANAEEIHETIVDALIEVAESAGVAVDKGTA